MERTVERRMELARDLMEVISPRPDAGDEKDVRNVEYAVEKGVLPESVLDDHHDRDIDVGEVSRLFSGFSRAQDHIEESRHPNRSTAEQLFRAHRSITDEIRNIDHRGRGSGCCQHEHGLKKQRLAVRWVLTGEWAHSL